MDDSRVPDEIETVARRADFLERLADGPLHKPEMVERLGHSRSTVDRAIKALEAAGFVERVPDGYVTTTAGRLAVDRYRSFVRAERSVLAAREVLDPLPADLDVPPSLLEDARVETVDAGHQLFEAVVDRLATADSHRAAIARLDDSRHLRVLHRRVVAANLDATVSTSADVLHGLREEFPHLVAELVEAEGFEAYRIDPPPFTLLLTTTGRADDPAGNEVVLVTYDGAEVAGFVATDDDAACRWAGQYLDSLEADGRDATDELRRTGSADDIAPLPDHRLPTVLRSQGFVRVDDRYFERREPMAPTTAWRAGLDLPEVAAGYAVDRVPDGENGGCDADDGDGPTLTDAVLSRLADGADVVLLGPSGAGKSTVCKRVAVRWYEADRGPVLYRESGADAAFEATTTLERRLEAVDGRALVVVEDAVRSEANDVFDVVRAFGGTDDVVFLLDSRDADWYDPGERPLDARREAFRREAIETVRMPTLDEGTGERLADRVEALTGERIDVPIGSLLEAVGSGDGAGSERSPAPGAVFLLLSRLVRYVEPLATGDERATPTTLDEDVDGLRAALAAMGEAELDVGVHVNTLNVAGLGVHPEYVYALVAADRGDYDRATVDRALDRMQGSVLFAPDGPMDDPDRTVHATWSVRFLERLLADEGPERARRRFGRCLTALLALTDEERRETVARHVDGRPRRFERIVADPRGWADETVAEAFEVGLAFPKLAPLFGSTDGPSIEVTDACSERIVHRQHEWRGHMYEEHGSYDRAAEEYEALLEAVPDPGDAADPAFERLRARALLGLGQVERPRGNATAARDYRRRALEAYELLGDVAGIAAAHQELGWLDVIEANPESARDHLEAGLERYRRIDHRAGEATCLLDLGTLAMHAGDAETAWERFETGLDLAQSVDDRPQEQRAANNLAVLARRRGDPDVATSYAARAYDLATELGSPDDIVAALSILGAIALDRGHTGEAETHFDEMLAVAREMGVLKREVTALRNLGETHRIHGDLDAARDALETALERLREADLRFPRGQVGVRFGLGVTAFDAGDLERARERARDSLEFARNADDAIGEGTALRLLGRIDRREGDLAAAATELSESADLLEAAGVPGKAAQARRRLAAVARDRGDDDRARELLVDAVETFRKSGRVRLALDAAADLVEVCRARGDEGEAVEWCETAVTLATTVGLADRRDAFEQRVEAIGEPGRRESDPAE